MPPLKLPVALLALVPLFSGGQSSDVILLVPAARWQLVSKEAWPLERFDELSTDVRVEREYGVRGVERRRYALGGTEAEAFLFETPDASSAYGLLTFYLSGRMRAEPIAELTFFSKQEGFIVRGRYFVRVLRPGGRAVSDQQFRGLLIYMGGTDLWAGTRSVLPSPLPTEGLVAGSEKFVLGPHVLGLLMPDLPSADIGFAQGAEVHLGRYRRDGGLITLALIAYPTPQIARARFDQLRETLNFAGEGDGEKNEGPFWGRRTGSYVLLATGTRSADVANAFLDDLSSRQDVTWNEESPDQARDKYWAHVGELLGNLFLGNMLFMAFIFSISFAGGVLIFLIRQLIDQYLPHSILARGAEGGVIQLGLDRV